MRGRPNEEILGAFDNNSTSFDVVMTGSLMHGMCMYGSKVQIYLVRAIGFDGALVGTSSKDH